LLRDDGAVGEEEDPHAVPVRTILSTTCTRKCLSTGREWKKGRAPLLFVRNPVQAPPPPCDAVVDTEHINVLNLKSGSFDWCDDPSERAGSISAGEDVLVREETPGGELA
jgi:hypothetical protein